MEIIKATEAHISTIQQIAKRTWPKTFERILSSAQIEYMLELMYSNAALRHQLNELNHVFLLLNDSVDYCGYISYELNYKDKPETKIHKLYILPGSQGKGIGKKLITAVEITAVQSENYTLVVNVNRDNKAIDFYKNLGFNLIGHEDIDIGGGFLMEDAVMRKDL
jgi:GNAT superfamily N-acetyltransferase